MDCDKVVWRNELKLLMFFLVLYPDDWQQLLIIHSGTTLILILYIKITILPEIFEFIYLKMNMPYKHSLGSNYLSVSLMFKILKILTKGFLYNESFCCIFFIFNKERKVYL